MTIRLIVGLGNPDKQYQSHRHNAGFMCLDYFAQQLNIGFKFKKDFYSQLAITMIDNHRVYLLKPQTFINRSGQAVVAVTQFFDIKPEQILIIHDELDIAIQCVRLKFAGGHGGHNGLRDIIQHLSSANFYRLRLGIGRPDTLISVTDFVLQNFTQEQFKIFNQHLAVIFGLLGQIIQTKDLSSVMKKLHTKNQEL